MSASAALPGSPDAASAPVSHIAAQPVAGQVTADAQHAPRTDMPVEVGGREGPEPTRFGDWEKRGRCIDF